MDPTVAALLKNDQDFATKAMLSEWLADNVEKTVDSFWGNGVVATLFTSMALQGLEPYATYLKMPGDELIKPMTGGIQIIVMGGGIQTTWFVTDFRLGRGVLVDEWR